MIELTPQEHQFRSRIGELIQRDAAGFRTLRIARHLHVYNSGERNAMIYFIESGRVKLLLPTPEGKECLLSIRMAGDIFGELCLSGQAMRIETAVVMQDSTLKLIPHRGFIGRLQTESLLEDLVQYLAVRISEQHEIISTMATANSEQRLAKTLLSIGRRMGTSMSGRIVIDYRISHEELSEMVGTTRPRVGVFLKKFRALGLIQIGMGHRIIVDEEKLEGHIRLSALGEKTEAALSRIVDQEKTRSSGLDSEIPDASM